MLEDGVNVREIRLKMDGRRKEGRWKRLLCVELRRIEEKVVEVDYGLGSRGTVQYNGRLALLWV